MHLDQINIITDSFSLNTKDVCVFVVNQKEKQKNSKIAYKPTNKELNITTTLQVQNQGNSAFVAIA